MEFWLWISILIGSIVLEIITVSQLITIWFAVGALGALIALECGVPLIGQMIIFFVVSVLFILTCRPIAKKYLRGNIVPTNADRVVGQQAKLLESITDEHWGLVKIQGAEWHAVSVDGKMIEKDHVIEVLAIEGSKLIVKKI